MTRLIKSLVALLSIACCSIVAAETLNLSTPYTVSLSAWVVADDENICIPARSALVMTDFGYQSDTIQNMSLHDEVTMDIPDCDYYDYQTNECFYYNDSDEVRYVWFTLWSASYVDDNDVINNPISTGWVSYSIDSLEEDPLP
jgi:hypothetical protein